MTSDGVGIAAGEDDAGAAGELDGPVGGLDAGGLDTGGDDGGGDDWGGEEAGGEED